MPKVKLRFRKQEHELEVPAGANLLAAALEAGLEMRYGCSEATCGKCVCRVVAGADQVSPANQAEYARLGRDLIEQVGFRLACQMVIHGDAEVEQR